jgi:hypothetical protein
MPRGFVMLSRGLWFALLLASGLPAQEVGAVGSAPLRRTARIGRIEAAAAPVVDGSLDDTCWATAPEIGALVMVEPWQGQAPTQRTVVKVLHDARHLYFGLWCYELDATRIRATQRARDARLDPDDRVEILLDPFEDRRTAYFFQIGAGGSIGDALVSNNGARFDKPWDTVWWGEARVGPDGWFAELAIPFRSIPRRHGARSWGFNLRRHVRTHNEEYAFTNATQAVSFFRISELGVLEGFGELDGGLGLELVPYATARLRDERLPVDRSADGTGDVGGEIYYRLLPSLTVAATVNTDFGETEDDDRQINFNRFPLFFPEKRDFFLDGIGYFGFGASGAGGSSLLPYFSRRIGLGPDARSVPILGGIKLAGQTGDFELGLLDVATDATASSDRENLAIGRLKYALGEQTYVGVLGTAGDPRSRGDNQVAGADFAHRLPRLVGDLDLRLSVDALCSDDAQHGTGSSGGLQIESRGREWELALGSRWVSPDFEPALGFVRRRDTRASRADLGWSPRLAAGSALRTLELRTSLVHAEAYDGTPQDLGLGLDRLGVAAHTGDRVYAFARRSFERVDRDFTLFRGSVAVPADDYWNTRYGLGISSTEARAANLSVVVEGGDFFGGRSTAVRNTAEWRVSALSQLGLVYQTARVDLGPGQAFTTQLATVRADLHFSPMLSLRNLVQFDNESNLFGWQSRLRWIYAPGCDLFGVLGLGWQRDEDGSIAPTGQAVQIKIAHSLRF